MVGKGDKINHLIVFRQFHHGLEDSFVRWPIKFVWIEDFQRSVQRPVVQEDRSKHSLLGFQILGRKSERASLCWIRPWKSHHRPFARSFLEDTQDAELFASVASGACMSRRCNKRSTATSSRV